MACALAAIDVKDFACHEARPFEVKDRIDDVGDLAQPAHRVQGGELRILRDGMRRDERRADALRCMVMTATFDAIPTVNPLFCLLQARATPAV